jgi:hypothetical protein
MDRSARARAPTDTRALPVRRVGSVRVFEACEGMGPERTATRADSGEDENE